MPGRKPIRFLEKHYYLKPEAIKKPIHYWCVSQHTVVLIPTSRGNLYPNIGLIWVDIVLPENWEGKTLWWHTGSLPPWRTCWSGQRLQYPRLPLTRVAIDAKLANIVLKFPNWGIWKNMNSNTTYNTITKGTCQSNNLIYCLECNWCHIKYAGQK